MGKKPPRSSDIEAAFYTPSRSPLPTYHPPPPRPWIPWLVPLIFIANVAMFVYSMYVNDCPDYLDKDDCIFSQHLGRFSFQPFNENPLLGPSTRTLRDLGALDEELVLNDNQAWRFFTSMFLHAGVLHLLANMVSLLFIGIRMEKEFGFLRIGFLYILSGFGGGLLSMLHTKQATAPTISVGASGALFGLLGAMLSELLTNWSLYANKCAALLSLLVIIAINLAIGFVPRVDNSAHIGGFLAGFFLGFVLLMRPQYGYVNRKHVLVGYAYLLAKLYIGDSIMNKFPNLPSYTN